MTLSIITDSRPAASYLPILCHCLTKKKKEGEIVDVNKLIRHLKSSFSVAHRGIVSVKTYPKGSLAFIKDHKNSFLAS